MLDSLRLRWGEELYAYAPDRGETIGPIAAQHIGEKPTFIIPPISGDAMVLELYVPAHLEANESVHVKRLIHLEDPRGMFNTAPICELPSDDCPACCQVDPETCLQPETCNACGLGWTGGSYCNAACTGDAECADATPWKNQRRAVVKILTALGDIGSGVLLNNDAQDGRGLVLTAGHLSPISTDMLFMFNYESDGCDPGSVEPSTDMWLCSATSLAQYDAGASLIGPDYQLVELHDPIPAEWDVFYAGWSRSSAVPGMGALIHHPAGFIKKISFGDSQPVAYNDHYWSASFSGPAIEGGSSGAPLYDQNGRVVGVDHGPGVTGQVFCRLESAWDNNPAVAAALSPQQGLVTLNGLESPPPVVTLLAPDDGVDIYNLAPALSWSPAQGQTVVYDIEIDDDPGFGSTDRHVSGVTNTSWTVDPPLLSGTYYWRVLAHDEGIPAASWSDARQVTVLWPNTGEDAHVAELLHPEAEVGMAICPTDPNLIAVAGHSPNDPLRQNSWINSFVSTDGGSTWNHVELRSGDGHPSGGTTVRLDPSVCISDDGVIHIAYIVKTDGGVLKDLVCATSTDNGMSYVPRIVPAATNAATLEKCIIATGPSASVPSQRNVYIAYTRGDGELPAAWDVYVAVSTDGGQTFLQDQPVYSVSGYSTFGMPAVGPGGELYVVLEDAISEKVPPTNEGPSQVVAMISVDDGSTFSAPVVVGETDITPDTTPEPTWERYVIAAQPNRGIQTVPSIAVDRSNGPNRGRVYVAYTKEGTYHSSGVLTDTDVVVQSYDPGDPWDGSSWSMPTVVHSTELLDQIHSQFLPWMAVDPISGILAVAWLDTRGDASYESVNTWLSYSDDGGASWNEVQLSEGRSNTANDGEANDYLEYIGLDIVDGVARAVWPSNADGGDLDFVTDALEILPPVTPLAEKSADTQMDFTGVQPYAAVAYDYDGDGKEDILASMEGSLEDVRLYQNVAPIGDAARFDNRRSVDFIDSDGIAFTPTGAKGVSFADYDNDGYSDLLMARPDGESYLFRGVPSGSKLQVVAGDVSVIPPAESLFHVEDGWTGSWGDYDRDGDVDIYIARSQASSATSAAFDAALGAPDVLLRNDGDGTSFVDVAGTLLPYGTDDTKTIGATWADVNGDGELDLYVSWLGPGDAMASPVQWSPLYVSDTTGGVRTFSDGTTGASPAFPKVGFANGAKFVDLDADGSLDITVTRQNDGSGALLQNILICLNDGAGQLMTEPEFGINHAGPTQNILIQDLDLNGILDVVAGPTVGASEPISLYQGYPASTGRLYVERGWKTEIQPGATGALCAADFNADSDADLFVGRSSDFYFANGTQAAGSGNAVSIELISPEGGNNYLGIGAVVTVEATEPGGRQIVQTQTVDGGSGRGSQEPHKLTFGIGEAPSATVTIKWPDGSIQPTPGAPQGEDIIVDAGESVVIEDAHFPSIIVSTVDASYYPSSGSVSLTFTWESDYISGDDEVVLSLAPRASPTCNVFPGGGDTYTLKKGEPGVSVSCVPILGGIGRYRHTVTLSAMNCVQGCRYNYQVNSYSGKLPGDTERVKSALTDSILIAVCGEIQG